MGRLELDWSVVWYLGVGLACPVSAGSSPRLEEAAAAGRQTGLGAAAERSVCFRAAAALSGEPAAWRGGWPGSSQTVEPPAPHGSERRGPVNLRTTRGLCWAVALERLSS